MCGMNLRGAFSPTDEEKRNIATAATVVSMIISVIAISAIITGAIIAGVTSGTPATMGVIVLYVGTGALGLSLLTGCGCCSCCSLYRLRYCGG